MKLRIWRPLTGDKRQILLLRRLHAVRVCHDPRQNASAFRFGYRGSGVIFEKIAILLLPLSVTEPHHIHPPQDYKLCGAHR